MIADLGPRHHERPAPIADKPHRVAADIDLPVVVGGRHTLPVNLEWLDADLLNKLGRELLRGSGERMVPEMARAARVSFSP